ncbi:MAG: carboxyltransferase domain-containing protein [Propionibacteriaceae bacterium]|jgi:KipI family sensor histidine kinase inhibitor|nr:carboxyltransferase domain-containing protein [Propionibacteriaceae bacterium]
MGIIRSIRQVGERALLAECADLAEVIALYDELARRPLPGQADLLSAARSVLVVAETPAQAQAMREPLASLPVVRTARATGTPIVIDVVYDGADLSDVAALLGLSPDAVIAAHTEQLWTGAFNGFAPGFAYCVGENQVLNVPRRPTPRTQVPAGSVGLAGEFSAIYPKASPGGWQLIGRTAAALWDLGRERPALINPGDRVRYVAVRELVSARAICEPALESVSEPLPDSAVKTGVPAVSRLPGGSPALRVIEPGWLSLIEDAGRPGLLGSGVSVSGAADHGAMHAANLALGNEPGAAVIETLGGLELAAHATIAVAVVRPGAAAEVTALAAGDILRVPLPTQGMRTYLAIPGGIDVPPVLGSRSTDLLAGLGPAPLKAGDVLFAGALAPPVSLPLSPNIDSGASASVCDAGNNAGTEEGAAGATFGVGARTIRITPGPRDDWLTAEAYASLGTQTWEVSGESNRIGLRLLGEPLRRAVVRELPSEGTQPGAIQLPPSGLPVVFLREHPVTGGYPVVAVVVAADLDVLAQARPGSLLRFQTLS